MKHALIATHMGSGGTLLCRLLSTNSMVRCFGRTGVVYDHPTALQKARDKINRVLKLNSDLEEDLYVDKLLFNYDFRSKALYSICKFIYLVRKPQVPLATLIYRGYKPKNAESYYLFRLRRLCEMACHTPGASLLTYEDLISQSGLSLLKNNLGVRGSFLDLFTPLGADDINLRSGRILKEPLEPKVDVPEENLNRCLMGYKRYLHFLEKKVSLIRFAA